MKNSVQLLTIGEMTRRSGVAASALRYYESLGLLRSTRGSGNQRRFHRSMLRRISIIRVAISLGLSLDEIGAAFNTLPNARTPTQKDWERLSQGWRDRLDQRIGDLQQLRAQLSGCIGCGCLSLKRCALYNPHDQAAGAGPGPRFLLGDSPANESSKVKGCN